MGRETWIWELISLNIEQCLKALNSLKSSNKGVYFEEDLYFSTYFLEVHFSTAFLTHFILRISTHHASYKNPNFSVPEWNGVGRKENVRIKVKWRMFRNGDNHHGERWSFSTYTFWAKVGEGQQGVCKLLESQKQNWRPCLKTTFLNISNGNRIYNVKGIYI